MSNSSLFDHPVFCPDSFLQENPAISSSLLAECDYNFDKVKTLIRPALDARDRCQVASFYIQAVATERNAFLLTNLNRSQAPDVTELSSSWLVGRNSTCDIVLLHATISRFHAAIGYLPREGFYLTDLNSANGTWVNHRRLESMQRCPLQDGDLIRISSLDIEFFLSGQLQRPKRPNQAVAEDLRD